ncbi:extracellular solute-binding protein [Clostridiales bacterium COT073_COT-073]|nr:extracellular solute-binding protein [Clostridiales bacterium COT073_COT-073]
MKKVNKKTFMLLMAVLCTVMLFGCSGTTDNSKEKTSTPDSSSEEIKEKQEKQVQTITIWHSADATIADTLQKQVDSLNPDVNVKFERKENMAESLKLVGNDPESAPDMYLWAHDKVGVFAEMGILSPITDFIGEEETKALIPMTLEAGKYDGQNYQLPIYYEALLFMYNKALVKEVPKTTDELLQRMKSETKDGHYVFVEQHSTSYCSAPWIQGFQGYIINESKTPGLDLPETIQALEYHKEFVPYMPADGEYNTVTTLFTEGKSEFAIGGPWLVPGLKEAKVDLGIASMPVLPNGNPLKPFSGVQGIHVLKHVGENKKGAVASVLKVLVKPEVGIALAEAANCAPANVRAYDNVAISENEMIMALREMAENVVPMPNVPEMDVMWGITDELLASINKNNGNVAEECRRCQKMALEQIEAMH